MSHYCVNCGTPLVARVVDGQELEGCEGCGFVLWRDPKVVTMVVVEDGAGEVILGRRGTEPGYGLWCLPGGFVNDHEHPAESAARECLEEINAGVDITGLLGVYHIGRRDAPGMVAIAYRGRLRAGEVPSTGSEMLEVAAFGRDDLPELVFPSHREAMRDWLAAGEESFHGVSPHSEEP